MRIKRDCNWSQCIFPSPHCRGRALFSEGSPLLCVFSSTISLPLADYEWAQCLYIFAVWHNRLKKEKKKSINSSLKAPSLWVVLATHHESYDAMIQRHFKIAYVKYNWIKWCNRNVSFSTIWAGCKSSVWAFWIVSQRHHQHSISDEPLWRSIRNQISAFQDLYIYNFFEPQFPVQLLGTSLWEPNWLRINEGEAVSRANIFN